MSHTAARSPAPATPETARSDVREALEQIAKQKTSSEWKSEFGDEFSGDFVAGYDKIIDIARAALASSPVKPQGVAGLRMWVERNGKHITLWIKNENDQLFHRTAVVDSRDGDVLVSLEKSLARNAAPTPNKPLTEVGK